MNTTKIINVRTSRVAVPIAKPLGVGSWWNKIREFILVWIETDHGPTGVGFCYGGFVPNQGRLIEVCVDELLRPLLIGEDPEEVERLWHKMYDSYAIMARKGLMVWAISALDCALWDYKAKAAGVPLARLLGGYRTEMMAYATGGYYRQGEGLKELAEEMSRYRKQGLMAVKLKVGLLEPRQDAERVRVCREVLGPDIKLAIDANNAWRTAPRALQAIRMMEPYDLWFIEEPVGPDNLSAAAEIAANVDVPIANGEPAVTKWDLRDLVTQKACDILQLDVTMNGGFTESLKGAHLAECFDLPVIPVWFADIHIQLACAVRHCIAVEWHVPGENTLQFAPLIKEPLKFKNGFLLLPDRPGIGIEFDERQVRKYAATR
jgi:L-alanine-DL-glutamate epimerase-like enolase superfamily enzyme